jgi:hypothetical protein
MLMMRRLPERLFQPLEMKEYPEERLISLDVILEEIQSMVLQNLDDLIV